MLKKFCRLTVHSKDDSVVFIDDEGGWYVGHSWQGEIARSHDLAAVERALRSAPRPRRQPKLGLGPKKNILAGPPVPSTELTAKAESFAFRRGRGEGAYAAAAAYRTQGGHYVATAGGEASVHRSASAAQAAAIRLLRAADVEKLAERRAKREKTTPPPSTPPAPEESP